MSSFLPISPIGVSPKVVFYLIALFAVVVFILYHVASVARLDAKVADVEKKLTESKAQVKQLQTALQTALEANQKFTDLAAEQNSKIASLGELAKAREQAVTSALAQIKKQRELDLVRYQSIIAGPPANDADLCGSLQARLKQYNAARLLEIVK